MKSAAINDRLAGLGGAKWAVHQRGKALAAEGRDIVFLSIGEPDVPTPPELISAATASLSAGRTAYSDGRGEVNLRTALASAYTASRGRSFSADNILCFPGTQTALFIALMGLVEAGDEVLVGDPMYATYEAVVRAPGAELVPVPLRAEVGFRMQPADVAARITPRTRAILLNTPHNPTGAILTPDDLRAICALAVEHDLWIISDEVYEHLVFEGSKFISPLAFTEVADRVIAVSSISKSHAAPGFRSGWCVASTDLCDRLLPLSETMLFGNQPFIADMTEAAIRDGSSVARGMCQRFSARAARLARRLEEASPLRVHRPEAGMFALIDVSFAGMSDVDYAMDLLERGGVATMPGASFGDGLRGWLRIALTADDADFDRAIERIVGHARTLG